MRPERGGPQMLLNGMAGYTSENSSRVSNCIQQSSGPDASWLEFYYVHNAVSE